MYSLFENLLAASDKDVEVWIQFIVVAIIIVFGILKAIARRIKAMREQKSAQSESEYKPPPAKPRKRYVAADGSYKTLEQLRQERIAQIRAAFGIPQPQPPSRPQPVTVETPQVADLGELGRAEKIEKPPAPPPVPEPQPVPSKIAADRKKAHIPTAVPTGERVHKLLFSSPGDLRNAVLYQEILGKPLALRDT